MIVYLYIDQILVNGSAREKGQGVKAAAKNYRW